MKLLDSYENIGKGKDSLRAAVETLTNMTAVYTCKSDDLELWTVKTFDEKSMQACIYKTRKASSKEMAFESFVDFENLTFLGADQDILNEMSGKNPLLIKAGKDVFFTSENIFQTLCQRAGTSAGETVKELHWQHRVARDQMHMSYMALHPCNIVFLYRYEGTVKKIFAAFTAYGYVPQKDLIDGIISGMEKDLGECEVSGYNVNHMSTKVYFEFPEQRDDFSSVYQLPETVTPGVILYTSDVGKSSVIAEGTYVIGKHSVLRTSAIAKEEHSKNASLGRFLEKMEKKIFREYTKLPERLAELITVDINSPQRAVDKAMKTIKSTLAPRSYEKLYEQINAAVGLTPCTAYDIYSAFLDVVDTYNDKYSEDKARKFSQSVIDIAFIDFRGL